jgi:hypothetical protein
MPKTRVFSMFLFYYARSDKHEPFANPTPSTRLPLREFPQQSTFTTNLPLRPRKNPENYPPTFLGNSQIPSFPLRARHSARATTPVLQRTMTMRTHNRHTPHSLSRRASYCMPLPSPSFPDPPFPIRASSFELRASFEFRVSSFELPSSPVPVDLVPFCALLRAFVRFLHPLNSR